MARSEKYKTQRSLAAALGTDGSLVGKWLNGNVKKIESAAHQRKLPELLKTSKDYFSDPSRAEREAAQRDAIADLAAGLNAARLAHNQVVRRVEDLETAVARLRGVG